MCIRDSVDAVRESPETVLFIDEIHTVIGAGSTSSGQTLDAADLLKPALEMCIRDSESRVAEGAVPEREPRYSAA